jgi:hypothetical protein
MVLGVLSSDDTAEAKGADRVMVVRIVSWWCGWGICHGGKNIPSLNDNHTFYPWYILHIFVFPYIQPL